MSVTTAPNRGMNASTPRRERRVVTRELLLSGSDCKDASESRWAELERGDGTSATKAAEIRRAEARANEVLRAQRRAYESVKAAKRISGGEVAIRRVQMGHAPRTGENARQTGSRRGRSSATIQARDSAEPSEPEPRLCLCGCGADLDRAGKRAGAEFLDDTHGKRYRRRVRRQEANRPLQALPTLWAAEERADRDSFRALVLAERDPPRKIPRPRLIDVEDGIDAEVLDVWIAETEGRAWRHGRHVLAKAVAA